jgi:hypothetical protein
MGYTPAMRPVTVILLLVIAGLGLFYLLRAEGEAAAGPPVALCPGPDGYGYTCTGADGMAYIAGTEPLDLLADDGAIQVALPFPFDFYGTSYEAVWISSNGNLQFRTNDSAFHNRCPVDGPIPELGDLIAVFWDDLDLSLHGELAVTTTGVAPHRIFVAEWRDVPPYGSTDGLTFAVQLHEGSNDIVVLYEDLSSGDSRAGERATVAIQSAEQGMALQYSCDQPQLPAPGGIIFAHPAEPPAGAGLTARLVTSPAQTELVAKGEVAWLIAQLDLHGRAALGRLQRHWLSTTPPQHFTWAGSATDGTVLAVLWRSPAGMPNPATLALLREGEAGRWQLLAQGVLDSPSPTRRMPGLAGVADLTGDGADDIVLHDRDTGALAIALGGAELLQITEIPFACTGNLILRDADGDGRIDLLRKGCLEPVPAILSWQDGQFVELDNP